MRSTDSAGNFAISAMQSPTRIRLVATDSKLTRGVRADAPRRDTTMTQNSDPGDAAGDAGPTTDERIMPGQSKKRLNRQNGGRGRGGGEPYGRRRISGGKRARAGGPGQDGRRCH